VNKSDIPEIARSTLNDLLNEAGSILYSSHETLRPNDVYLLGFNPGGSGGNSISYSINRLLNNEQNAYLDECWKNPNGSWRKGGAPLQKRVDWLLKNIGYRTREVCSSNLIFFQSQNANNINYSLAKRCWPVHEAILEIVKPKLIITFGNSNVSPFSYLHGLLGGVIEYTPSGHGNWNIKEFEATINNCPIYVAGIPHLSRYSPIGKECVIDWLNSK